MSKTKEMQRQCCFVQKDKDNVHTTAWVPESSAKVGQCMKFKDADSPDDEVVWKVTSVGETRKTREEILGKKRGKFPSIGK